jgi:nucleotide-binding universal stress UspA family protein
MKTPQKILSYAENYLAKSSINGNFIIKQGSVAENVIHTADENQCDFIIMGGYGNHPYWKWYWVALSIRYYGNPINRF